MLRNGKDIVEMIFLGLFYSIFSMTAMEELRHISITYPRRESNSRPTERESLVKVTKGLHTLGHCVIVSLETTVILTLQYTFYY